MSSRLLMSVLLTVALTNSKILHADSATFMSLFASLDGVNTFYNCTIESAHEPVDPKCSERCNSRAFVRIVDSSTGQEIVISGTYDSMRQNNGALNQYTANRRWYHVLGGAEWDGLLRTDSNGDLLSIHIRPIGLDDERAIWCRGTSPALVTGGLYR